MFDTGVLNDEEVFTGHNMAEKEVSTIDPVTTTGEVVTTTSVEPEKSTKKKDQIRLDEELAFKLQAGEEEEERLAREKVKANVALIEEWNDIQAKIKADQLLAETLQAREQEEWTTEERAKLFQQSWRKEENSLAEGSSNRTGEDLQQESTKKQKMDEDKEIAELQSLMKIVPDEEEVAIDAIPLAIKPPTIFDYKIIKEGKISFFQIIRADGSSKRYSAFIQILKNFDREDLETLWKLVKAKHGSTRPEEGYERVLLGDLRTMFEHHIEDTVWRNLQGNKVLIWKLFDSCGVHFMRFQDMHIFMLVEKRYPLTPATITEMLNTKLQADHWNEMCYQLLKLITKQLKNQ
ncbi:hypothetical protein Tco_0058805 [Tanacetum coccineum]